MARRATGPSIMAFIEGIDPEKMKATTADGVVLNVGYPVFDIEGEEFFTTGWKCVETDDFFGDRDVWIVARAEDNTTSRLAIETEGYSSLRNAMIANRKRLGEQIEACRHRIEIEQRGIEAFHAAIQRLDADIAAQES